VSICVRGPASARTDPKGTLVDLADRDRRMTRAQSLVRDLVDRGVVAVATSFVDNAASRE
jgi:hypothetical protein